LFFSLQRTDMKELLKLSLILAIICCGAALALGCVYELTKDPIAEQQRLKKQRAVKAVFPKLPLGQDAEGVPVQLCDNASPSTCREIFLLTAEERLCGTALETRAAGYNGPIDCMVGILPDGTLSAITIISHTETPGLGANITRQSFCSQFFGLTEPESLELKKNGGTIDQVTGATISSEAVLQAVREQMRFYRVNRSEIISAHTKAHGERS
jgi:electron transport complex protein RnfG